MDETGLKTTTTKPPKVLSSYEKRQVGVVSSLERGTLTTAIACCNAAGSFLPPFLIFKRKKACMRLLNGALPGAQATFTESGWINCEKFYDWLVFFVEQTRPTSEHKVLLILDNHVSHKSYTALQYASDQNVLMLSIPPHTSHKLQPLNVGVYGPFKTYFEQEIYTFQKQYPGRIINELDISRLFSPAFLKAAAPMNAINAFRATGIWPFNKFVFDEEIYVTSSHSQKSEDEATMDSGNTRNNPSPLDPLSLNDFDNEEENVSENPLEPRLPPPTAQQSTEPQLLSSTALLSTPPRCMSLITGESPRQSLMKTPPLPSKSTSEVTPAHLRPLPIYAKDRISKKKRMILQARRSKTNRRRKTRERLLNC